MKETTTEIMKETMKEIMKDRMKEETTDHLTEIKVKTVETMENGITRTDRVSKTEALITVIDRLMLIIKVRIKIMAVVKIITAIQVIMNVVKEEMADRTIDSRIKKKVKLLLQMHR